MNFGTGFSTGALALRRRQLSGFSPLSLSPTGLFDPAVTGALFQDSARTTAISGDGSEIGCMADLSGNGNDLLQADIASKPLYRTDGTLHWVAGDGIDDYLEVSALPVSGTHTIVCAANVTFSANGNASLISMNAANDYQLDAEATGEYRLRLSATNLGTSVPSTTSRAGARHVYALSFDAAAGVVTCRVDGVQVWQDIGYNGALDSVQSFKLLANRGAFAHVTSDVYFLAIWNGASQEDIVQAEIYAAGKAGIPL